MVIGRRKLKGASLPCIFNDLTWSNFEQALVHIWGCGCCCQQGLVNEWKDCVMGQTCERHYFEGCQLYSWPRSAFSSILITPLPSPYMLLMVNSHAYHQQQASGILGMTWSIVPQPFGSEDTHRKHMANGEEQKKLPVPLVTWGLSVHYTSTPLIL